MLQLLFLQAWEWCLQKKTESSRSELTSEASNTSEASRTSEARNNSWGSGGAVSPPPPRGVRGTATEAFAILTILEPQTPYFQLVKDEKMKFHQTKNFIFEGWWFALVGFWQSSQQLKLRYDLIFLVISFYDHFSRKESIHRRVDMYAYQ